MAEQYFWTSAQLEPKRKFRFQVQISNFGGASDAIYLAKSVSKPTVTIESAAHKYLNHTFYYPGKPEWSEVEAKFIDAMNPDTAQNFSAMLEASGYIIPNDANTVTTISKANAARALGQVRIMQFDDSSQPNVIGNGGRLIETWTLNNAHITEVNFGDLAYEDNDLNEVSVKFRYDWATLTTLTDNTLTDKVVGIDDPSQRWKPGPGQG